MEIIKGIDNLDSDWDGAVLSIGNFDGVHLAHKNICAKLKEKSKSGKLRSVILTFDPHPLSIVAPERCPSLMTTLSEKTKRLEDEGIDIMVVEPFTKDLSDFSPEQFVSTYITNGIKAKEVLVGYNFHFGKNRGGNIEFLKTLGKNFDFLVEVLEPFAFQDKIVSSTEIRKMLSSGSVAEANVLLGTRHCLEGLIEKGDGRGAGIGFPTANVAPPSTLIPSNGVYACWSKVKSFSSDFFPTVLNIGKRPTFDGQSVTIEAHILNWEGGNIYGKEIRLEFVERIRDEFKFSSVEKLVQQISLDVEKARAILEK
tara:strand:- start:5106 stop:6041 length:936 start_codon:yes stop_codon:yes gene_type:complete